MPDFLSVSEAARELNEQLGIAIRPQDITNLFYRRELRDDACPIVGGRRLIPRDHLAMIGKQLRQRGLGRRPRGESK
jgi:hypothetical protein